MEFSEGELRVGSSRLAFLRRHFSRDWKGEQRTGGRKASVQLVWERMY